MYRAAVIGDRDSIYGFAALGLEVFPVTDSEMGSKTLRRLAESEYAVIYITEALAAELEHELDHFRLQPLPAIVPLQLFACEVATLRGHDVDQPRNLAKSVTVE